MPLTYLAPEVAIGLPESQASDVWALGHAIFRIRAGVDLFPEYETNCPADVLAQTMDAIGELPEEWKRTRFNQHGFAADDEDEDDLLWTLESPEDTGPNCGLAAKDLGDGDGDGWSSKESRLLENRVRRIPDEPPALFIHSSGRAATAEDMEAKSFLLPEQIPMTAPYSAALSTIIWKPTAICVAGFYPMAFTNDKDILLQDDLLQGFPRIPEREASLLLDLLSKIFTYDPATRRPKGEDLVAHPWFHLAEDERA